MTALESVQTTGNEKIKGIIKGYSEIVIDCLDEKKKKEFEMDPIPRLREIGMIFPENSDNITVELDPKLNRWPTAHIYSKKNDKWVVIEELVSVLSQQDGLSDMIKEKVDEDLQDCKVLIKIPFVDMNVDKLSEIKFNDAEIVLSSCC